MTGIDEWDEEIKCEVLQTVTVIHNVRGALTSRPVLILVTFSSAMRGGVGRSSVAGSHRQYHTLVKPRGSRRGRG